MNQVSKNKYLSIAADGLEFTATLCSTGTLMQALLASLGFSTSMIYIQSTAVQAATVLTILLASRWADGSALLKRHAFVRLLGGLLFLFYLPLCIIRQANAYTYLLLIIVSVLQAVTTGLHTVCLYKLPYYIYEARSYGVITAICGIMSNILSFFVGALMSYLSQIYPYVTLMLFALVLSFAFSAIAGICRLRLKPLTTNICKDSAKDTPKIPLKIVILNPCFRNLIPANLMRGFANGATTILAVIASNHLGYSESVTAAIVSIQSVAMLAAYGLFAVSTKLISPRVMILCGSICFLCLPLLLIPNQPILFLLFVGVTLLGRTLVDSAVPTVLLYAVPVDIAGPYHAWRMALHNAGTLSATLLATFLPIESILLIALLCQVYSGIVYWRSKFLCNVSPAQSQTIS